MQAVLAALRDAEWLNGTRARVYPRLLLAASVGLALIWIVAARGGVDLAGKPLGTDFLSFFAASELTLQRPRGATPTTSRRIGRRRRRCSARRSAIPPSSIRRLICSSACRSRSSPISSSLIVWLAATGYAYWRVLRAWAGPRFESAVLLAFPAFLVNAGHGQNGFLSAALIGAGGLMLDAAADRRRPAVRRARLQAATGADDSDRADRLATLDDLCRRRRLRGGAVRSELCDLGRAGLARLPRRYAHGARGARAPSRRRRKDAERRSPRCGCCMGRWRSPMPRKA